MTSRSLSAFIEAKIRTHRNPLAWQEAMKLVAAVYQITQRFPRNEWYGQAAPSRPTTTHESCLLGLLAENDLPDRVTARRVSCVDFDHAHACLPQAFERAVRLAPNVGRAGRA